MSTNQHELMPSWPLLLELSNHMDGRQVSTAPSFLLLVNFKFNIFLLIWFDKNGYIKHENLSSVSNRWSHISEMRSCVLADFGESK